MTKNISQRKIRYGDIVIYAVGGHPLIGIVCSQDRDSGKYRVVPTGEVNHTSKKYEKDLITLDDIRKAKELLGRE